MPDIWYDVDTALAEVPVNQAQLIDDTDFKAREEAITYDQAGMDLVWEFYTPAGAATQTAVTPTTGGAHDWAHLGNGIYTLEIPASAGTINNDTEGFGRFVGYATGVLPWRGPWLGFRAAGLNDKMVETAYSATLGLAGTALPNAVADAAGGLAISDAGGLDVDNNVQDQIEAHNLDHLALTATGAADMTSEVADNTILSRVLANGDTSAFVPSTDGLQPIRDQGDSAWVTATGFALASVVGALADAAAAGDPTTGDTVMQYVKQLINVLVGTTGIGTWPTAAAPANGVNLFEAQRAIYDDTNELQSDDVPGLISDLNDPTATAIVNEWETQSQADPTGFHVNLLEVGGTAQTAGDVIGDTNDIQGRLPASLVGGRIDANVGAISGDSTAADNEESFFDGTGYAGTGNVIPTVTTLTDVTDITQRQIPDSVPNDGTLPTIEQSLYMITQFLYERAVSSTTVTVKKVDGSISLLTLTLDDATNPTSITRAS